jgi:hypothetical protein
MMVTTERAETGLESADCQPFHGIHDRRRSALELKGTRGSPGFQCTVSRPPESISKMVRGRSVRGRDWRMPGVHFVRGTTKRLT